MWTIIGTIASVLGGLFSWRQALKAKDYANGMVDGKKDAKKKNRASKLSEVLNQTKRTKSEICSLISEGKKAAEIQSKIDDYLTNFSEVVGLLDAESSEQLKKSQESLQKKSASLKDDDKFSSCFNGIKIIFDSNISALTRIIEDSTFTE